MEDHPDKPEQGKAAHGLATRVSGRDVSREVRYQEKATLRLGQPGVRETTIQLSSAEQALFAQEGRLPPADQSEYAPPRSVRILRQGERELVLTLYPDTPLLLGRGPQCNVVIPSNSVSREHARLWMREDGVWVIRDLGSRNGSFLVRRRHGHPESPGDTSQLLSGQDVPLVAGDVVLLAGNENRMVMEAGAQGSSEASLAMKSAVSRSLAEAIQICATHRLAVFLIGPSGSGKTHVARHIHEAARMQGQFILVNCGRLPTDPVQLQSELLGHTRGAFTGAIADRVGKFHAADGGTLFLDEVEHLPPAAQDFLIDLLDGSGSFAPLGAPATRRWEAPKVRIIAASKKQLALSGLRADLCQRLAAADVIALPTLDERREDIPGLVEEFLRQFGRQQAVHLEIEPDAAALLQQESWPGQVRELETVVKVTAAREHARLPGGKFGDGTIYITAGALKQHLENRKLGLGTPHPTVPVHPTRADHMALAPHLKRPRDLLAEDVRAALEKHGGNKTLAAEALGIAVNTLKKKMKAFGLD